MGWVAFWTYLRQQFSHFFREMSARSALFLTLGRARAPRVVLATLHNLRYTPIGVAGHSSAFSVITNS